MWLGGKMRSYKRSLEGKREEGGRGGGLSAL